MQRLTDPRIEPLEMSHWEPDLRVQFERPGGLGQVFNVMKTLANHAGLFKRWSVFASHFLFKISLPVREREILILRTGWLAGCEYEWGQHLKISAEDASFGEAEFSAIAHGADAALWTPAEAAIIRAADGIYTDAFVDDATWSHLMAHYTEPQVLDVVFIVCNYMMLAMGINAFGVQLDTDYDGFSPNLPINHHRPSPILPKMGVRRPTPRLGPLSDAECSPAQLEVLTKARGHLDSVNVLDTLVRHPDLLRRWMPFFAHILFKTSLPERDREILILRVGRLCGAEYEWAQHVPFAERAGLSTEEINGLAAGADDAVWTEEHDRTLIRAADQLHRETMLDDDVWNALNQSYTTEQLMDAVFTVGQYRLVSAVLNTLCVQLDSYLKPYTA